MNDQQPNTGAGGGNAPATIEEAANAVADAQVPQDGTPAPQGGTELERVRAENESLKKQIGEQRAQEGGTNPADGFPQSEQGTPDGTPPAPQGAPDGTPPQQPQQPAAPGSVTQEGFPETPSQAPQPGEGMDETQTQAAEMEQLRRDNAVNRFFLDNVQDPSLTPEVKTKIRDMVMDKNMTPEDAAKIALYDAGYAHSDQAAGRPNPGASFADRTAGEQPQSVEKVQEGKSAQQRREEGNQAIRNQLVGDGAPGKVAFSN